MNNYVENEIKVLNIDVKKVRKNLETMGSNLVFDGERSISTFDNSYSRFRREDLLLRLTQEKLTKITVHVNNSSTDRKVIKLHTLENWDIVMDFFLALGLSEQTHVISHRISFERGVVDFDIDQFPLIPPFLEIDLDKLDCPLEKILEDLQIKENRIVTCGTEEIFRLYGLDYYTCFSVNQEERGKVYGN